MSRIVDFYLGKTRHPLGVTIEQIWTWNDYRLEAEHTYIQWLFPLPEPSLAVPGSPVLTDSDVEWFRADAELQRRLLKSYARMLAFYGFVLQGSAVAPGDDFARRSAAWLTRHNHNHLRITRILKCLVLAGQRDAAERFFHALQDVYRTNAAVIGETTLEYWRNAVK